MQNAEELINAATTFEQAEPEATLRDWLEYTSLLGDVDAVEESSGRVTLMTLHAAKGLEFPAVYMIALEEGILPFRRDRAEVDNNEEEERRLCFVGMTRAQRKLTLSHTLYRMVRGASERKVRSRFLQEVSAAEVDWVDLPAGSSHSGGRGAGGGALPSDIEQWEVGTLVRHAVYDLGRIVWLRPNGAQTRIGVQFQSGAEKTFDLRFAELKRVDFDEVE